MILLKVIKYIAGTLVMILCLAIIFEYFYVSGIYKYDRNAEVIKVTRHRLARAGDISTASIKLANGTMEKAIIRGCRKPKVGSIVKVSVYTAPILGYKNYLAEC